MKDRRARVFLLPKKLVGPMRDYLDRFRPTLAQDSEANALWLNQYGNAITPDGFSRELPKVTRRFLGVPLRTQAFRHIAATSIAETDPEHVNIIKDILGHVTLEMSERHYNRAQGVSSCSQFQSIVEDIQDRLPIVGRADQNKFSGRPRS
ncbi:site-specific tyrosine recombinase XerC [Roseovarius litorisediminis]|uniref:Site-specific tyrosine recombinase XerC n=2 Tax=Roseovarius litorisediminis TaxID=1312363 RepID=A0A1Y5TMA1_9RHOB|nr:site-specific tyrosine recombinase XerC [Roseovarius litorisediminis]